MGGENEVAHFSDSIVVEHNGEVVQGGAEDDSAPPEPPE